MKKKIVGVLLAAALGMSSSMVCPGDTGQCAGTAGCG